MPTTRAGMSGGASSESRFWIWRCSFGEQFGRRRAEGGVRRDGRHSCTRAGSPGREKWRVVCRRRLGVSRRRLGGGEGVRGGGAAVRLDREWGVIVTLTQRRSGQLLSMEELQWEDSLGGGVSRFRSLVRAGHGGRLESVVGLGGNGDRAVRRARGGAGVEKERVSEAARGRSVSVIAGSSGSLQKRLVSKRELS